MVWWKTSLGLHPAAIYSAALLVFPLRRRAALIGVSVRLAGQLMEVFTFWPVSVVIAKPLGTRPAVLCFFTSLTVTTGMATWTTEGHFL